MLSGMKQTKSKSMILQFKNISPVFYTKHGG